MTLRGNPDSTVSVLTAQCDFGQDADHSRPGCSRRMRGAGGVGQHRAPGHRGGAKLWPNGGVQDRHDR